MKAALISGAALIGVSILLKNWALIAFILVLLLVVFLDPKKKNRKRK